MDNQKGYNVKMEKEDEMFVATCPELNIASQGNTSEEAGANLKEAIDLFFETASRYEVAERILSRSSIFRWGTLTTSTSDGVCEMLRERGFKRIFERGSHIVMQQKKAETTVTIPVPNHNKIKQATLWPILWYSVPHLRQS